MIQDGQLLRQPARLILNSAIAELAVVVATPNPQVSVRFKRQCQKPAVTIACANGNGLKLRRRPVVCQVELLRLIPNKSDLPQVIGRIDTNGLFIIVGNGLKLYRTPPIRQAQLGRNRRALGHRRADSKTPSPKLAIVIYGIGRTPTGGNRRERNLRTFICDY